MDLEKTKALITKHEGCVLSLYKDTTGHYSIGIGRNLSSNGISLPEADLMFRNDMKVAVATAEMLFPDVHSLTDARQAVLVDMAFNLGQPSLSRFKRLREAIKERDYTKACQSMRQSKWYKQVGNRATRLIRIMESGEWPED